MDARQRFTAEDVETWRRDGIAILRDFFTADEVVAVRADVEAPPFDGLRTLNLIGVHPADDEDDAADHPPVIDPRHAMRQWRMRLDPAHLRLRQPA